MQIIIVFLASLFSFSVLVLSVLHAIRYRKSNFANIGLVHLFFFAISVETLYSSVYGQITNQLFLSVFGSFCVICFSFGIINFSFDLVNANVKALIRLIPLFYSSFLLIIYIIMIFAPEFSQDNINYVINLFGIWIPSAFAIVISLIFIRRIKKGIFQKEKWLLLIMAICNIVFSVFLKFTPFIFIVSISVFEIVIFYKSYFAVPIKQNSKELTKKFIKDFNITSREQEIIKELLNGKTNKELAETFFVTEKTIEAHLAHIYKKTGVKNRFELFSRLKNNEIG